VHTDHFPPRALQVCPTITIARSASELSQPIKALEARAVRADDDPRQCDYADHAFRCVAKVPDAAW
jgi:hypothetical protein